MTGAHLGLKDSVQKTFKHARSACVVRWGSPGLLQACTQRRGDMAGEKQDSGGLRQQVGAQNALSGQLSLLKLALLLLVIHSRHSRGDGCGRGGWQRGST